MRNFLIFKPVQKEHIMSDDEKNMILFFLLPKIKFDLATIWSKEKRWFTPDVHMLFYVLNITKWFVI